MNIHPSTHPVEPEQLMAYLDGELAIDEAANVAAHLGQCSDCQSIVTDLKQVSLSTLAWQIESHSTQLPAALDEALYKLSFDPPSTPAKPTWLARLNLRFRSPWLWAGIPVAAVLAILLVIVAFPSHPAQHTAPYVEPLSQTESMLALRSPKPVIGPPQDRSVSPARSSPSILAPASTMPLAQSAPQSVPQPAAPPAPPTAAPPQQPLIVRTAQLSLTAADLDRTRQTLDTILNQHHGYLGNLEVSSATGQPRTLTATLRIPASELNATLTALRTLGSAEFESLNDDEVTNQYVDLDARLRNTRNTEARLTSILANRTGDLSDVLQVENQISRVRGEIERMESEKKLLETRIALSSINLTIHEQFKAQAQIVPDSTAARIRNAAIDGYRTAINGLLSVLLFLISAGPTILVWAIILFFPARYLWKKKPWRQHS